MHVKAPPGPIGLAALFMSGALSCRSRPWHDSRMTAPDPKPDTAPPPPSPPPEPEVGGRDGPDPVRYGDWEKGGIAVDF